MRLRVQNALNAAIVVQIPVVRKKKGTVKMKKMSELQQWEEVAKFTDRLKVDGGYLYRSIYSKDGESMSFVPDVDLQRYQAHLRDAYNQGFKDGLEEAKHSKE